LPTSRRQSRLSRSAPAPDGKRSSRTLKSRMPCSGARVTLWATLAGAATELLVEVKARHPEIPWERVRGFRNVAAHGYLDLVVGLAREIIETHLPVMKGAAPRIPPDAGHIAARELEVGRIRAAPRRAEELTVDVAAAIEAAAGAV